MSFSSPVITHSFSYGGAVAAGEVQFTLLGQMTNGIVTVMAPSQMTATLDDEGNLSQAVASNLDPGTSPAAPGNAVWRVDIRVINAQALSYIVMVPPTQTETNGSIIAGALNVVQLSSLTAASYMVGQSITGGSIPSSTTITAVNTTNNTVTISANASAGTALSLILGATIDLGQLLPTGNQAG